MKYDELCLNIAPVTILSSPSSTNKNRCIEQKTEWLKRHGIHCGYIFSKEKHKFATPSTLLIDDFKKNIRDFYNAGGQVHHFRYWDLTERYLNEIINFHNFINAN